MSIGRTRSIIANLPTYKPGKSAKQTEEEYGITGAIKLASNENPAAISQPVLDAITEAAQNINRYGDHLATELREAIAQMHGLNSEQIAVGPGSAGLLHQICSVYLEPGDNVVYPWRSFEAYPVFVKAMGAESVQVPLVDNRFDLKATAAAINPATKLVMLATPNNPTGIGSSVTELNDFISSVPSDVVIVIDEAYHEFADPDLGDPMSLISKYRNVVVTRTFSKAYGLAGIRVGYLAADPEIVTDVNKVLVPFAVNAIAQAAALAAIKNRASFQPAIDMICAERDRVSSILTERGWQLPPSQGNFVYLTLADKTMQYYQALETKGVVTRPFAGEGLRVTISSPEENDRFLEALEAAKKEID